MTTASAPTDTPAVGDQAKALLSQIAGYVGHRTVGMGLRGGLVAALAGAPDGLTADGLAERLELDPFYVMVWCRSAFAAGVCDRDGALYRLAPHMGALLLDTASPRYVGGVFTVLQQHEVFDRFEANLATGDRMWWDDTSPEWIAGVAGTGAPFYARLVPGGLAQVPGLVDRLAAGCRVLDTACGTGAGVLRLAENYPTCDIVGVDGDPHSLEVATDMIAAAGLSDRVTLVCSPLEELRLAEPVTLVINNISMHECRDIDRVTANVKAALEPGGWFVISDFPFPDADEALRSVPGRIMSGIQFFEAQIDDQLLPRRYYDELLSRHGFSDLGAVELTPMHALTHGRA
ncbi:hypothetical protein BH20ACT8_BH20ACT8_11130 [soil metagenome]